MAQVWLKEKHTTKARLVGDALRYSPLSDELNGGGTKWTEGEISTGMPTDDGGAMERALEMLC